MKKITAIVRLINVFIGIIIFIFFLYLGITSFNKISEKLIIKQEPTSLKVDKSYLEDFKKALEEYLR
jgi:hypothetical protein